MKSRKTMHPADLQFFAIINRHNVKVALRASIQWEYFSRRYKNTKMGFKKNMNKWNFMMGPSDRDFTESQAAMKVFFTNNLIVAAVLS